MAKVLSQLSSFLSFGPTSLHKLEKKYTVHCVHCHWDFKKCFNPSQTLFWKNTYFFLLNSFAKINKFNFTDEKLLRRMHGLHCMYVYSMKPSQYRAEKTIAATKLWSSTLCKLSTVCPPSFTFFFLPTAFSHPLPSPLHL